MADAYRDENRIPTLIGVSSVDGQTPTRIEANPTTNSLFVEITNASIPVTGTFYQATQPVSIASFVAVTNAGITTIAGAVSGTEMQVDVASITAGNNIIGQVKITDGTDIADVIDSGTYVRVGVYVLDGSGDPLTSFGGGTQYDDGDADATPTSTAAMGTDGHLQVDILNVGQC